MQIIVYRDGVGDGQLQMTIDHEVLQFRVRIIKTTDLTVIYGNLVRVFQISILCIRIENIALLPPLKIEDLRKFCKKSQIMSS